MSIPHIPEYQDPRIEAILERIEALEATEAKYKTAIHSFSEATKKLLEAEVAYLDPPYLVD